MRFKLREGKKMKSMTGFGAGVATSNGRRVTIELKSVNGRFTEINARIPKSLGFCDEVIKKSIAKHIKRGSVDVGFNYENSSDSNKGIELDLVLANAYVEAAKKLRTQFMLDYDFNTTALLRSPDVAKITLTQDEPDVICLLCTQATDDALLALNKMREVEGAAIKAHLAQLVKEIVKSLKEIAKRAPQIVVEYRAKIDTKMREILDKVPVDENRLLQEVAIFSDKSDVSEELNRLSSHIDQFVKAMELAEPVGRKLDFIAQEMNREINTIGSKSTDTTITNLVIALKNELEKVKEQIRNVE